MPMISENGPYTILMEYEVEQGRQHEMIAGVTDLIARHIASNPAFISASFHASDDGRRVINYAQWTSKAGWEAANAGQNDPVTQAIIAVITRCGGRRTRLDALQVARIVEGELVAA